jgi:hypothetical protein
MLAVREITALLLLAMFIDEASLDVEGVASSTPMLVSNRPCFCDPLEG